MKILPLIPLLAVPLLPWASPARAGDTDGPDCARVLQDFGDAPEGVPTYFGVIAHFPTLLAPGAPGTQESLCAPLGSAPGPTGFVRHLLDGTANYWLGCYTANGQPSGIDGEPDGLAPDGDETLFDGSDAGAQPEAVYALICSSPNRVFFTTWNCGPERSAYLNVLVDLNHDGDWNDSVPCTDQAVCFLPCPEAQPCAFEWAVRNQLVTVRAGCDSHVSPNFFVGGLLGPTWMRVTVSDDPVGDDFPWAGSANRPGGVLTGGETEDYLTFIDTGDPVLPSTWGRLKVLYR